MMTQQQNHTDRGILYMGLGDKDERFLAPYYWQLPSVYMYVPDYEHLLRLFLRNLKYNTRNLTFCSFNKSSHIATIHHIEELRQNFQYGHS